MKITSHPGKKREVKKIGGRNVSVIFLLGIAGQIAWAVENSWFNTFVFDKISTGTVPKATVISWMVVVSAIVATLTTIFMGTLSDRTTTRWGRRKPYIVLGYVIWGFTTAMFPMVAWIKNVGIVVVMLVITDAVMSFFGSTANDAAFNAWLTDIGHSSNRNRIQSLNQITGLIANMVALGAAGIIIDSFENGYFIFFFGLGGMVTLSGLISQFLIKENPIPLEKLEKHKPYWKEIIGTLSPGLIKENPVLYLLFLGMALSGAASQITAPYSFIYIEHHLGFSKSIISLIGIVIILASTGALALVGGISHKFNRKNLMILMTISGTVFSMLMAYQTSLVGLTIVYFLSLSSGLSASVILAAWMQDK